MAKRLQSLSRKKIGFLLVAFVVVSLISLHFGSKWLVMREADKFQPDASWKFVHEDVEPFRFLCIDRPCPSVVRSWERAEPVSCPELESYIPDEWGLEMEQDCVTNKNEFGNTATSYSAIGSIDGGYYVYLRDDPGDDAHASTSRIVLSVRKD